MKAGSKTSKIRFSPSEERFDLKEDTSRFPFLVGRDRESRLSILIPVIVRPRYEPTLRLSNLLVRDGLVCEVFDNLKRRRQGVYLVIQLLNSDLALENLFLKAMPFLIGSSLNKKSSAKDITLFISELTVLFQSLSLPPKKSLQGIWAELFIIYKSKNPKHLIKTWHYDPQEKYDFSEMDLCLEVKSSSSFRRKHFFALEQIRPAVKRKVLICSVIVESNESGDTIFDLVEKIKNRVKKSAKEIDRLNYILAKSLGSKAEEANRIKFNSDIAGESIVYVDAQSIPSVDVSSDLISDVRFAVDLSKFKPMSLGKVRSIRSAGKLFKAI